MHISHKPVEWGFLSYRRPAPKALKDYSLYKEFDTSGTFWRVDNPTHTISGRLSFVPGSSLVLSLDGSFNEGPHRSVSFPILQGRLSTGTPCTLLYCWGHVNAYQRNRSYFITELHSEYLLLGALYKNEKDIKIRLLDLQFSHLENWFDWPYKLIHGKDSSEILMRYNPNSLSTVVKHKGTECKIDVFCSRTTPLGAGPSKTSFEYGYRLHLSTKVETSIHWFLEVASILRESFLYLVGTGIYTLDIHAAEDLPKKRQDGTWPRTLKIYMGVDVPSVIRTDSSLYCTTYNKFKEHYPNFLANWFANRQDLSVVIDTYKETLLNDGAYGENIFLRLVQTLEHLHGLAFEGKTKYCRKEQWRKFTEWLDKNALEIEGNDGDHQSEDRQPLRDIILRRISNLNELSLKSRIENLIYGVPGSLLMPILNNPKDAKKATSKLITEIDNTRNYLTHFRRSAKKRAALGKDLEENTAILWAILSYWLGKLLNLEDKVLSDISFQAKRAMFLVGRKTIL